jgi:hypothetical protein
MVSTTLQRIDENLRAAGCSRALFSMVARVKPPTFGAAFQGLTNLGAEKEAALLTLSYRVREAAEACAPFSLPTNAEKLRVLIDRLMDETLTVEEIKEKVSSLFTY